MTLEDFRKTRGYTYVELAQFLEIKHGTVYNICKDIGCITLQNAYRIISKTRGQVAYVDLLETLEGC